MGLRSLAIGVLAAASLGSAAPALAQSDDWAMLRGSASRASASNGPSLGGSDPVWSLDTSGAAVYLYTLEAGGVVYGVGYDLSSNLLVTAFDATTGQVSWTKTFAGPAPGAAPAVGGGLLLVPETSTTSETSIQALDIASGGPVWSAALGSVDSASSPAIDGGKVFLSTSDSVYGRMLDVLDLQTGVVDATAAIGPAAFDNTSVAVNGTLGLVYAAGVASNVGYVRAYHADGSLAWNGEIPSGTAGYFTTPIVGDGRVYVGNVLGLVDAFDATSGAHLWRWTASPSASVNNDMAYVGGTLYVYNSLDMWALDAASGTEIWPAPQAPPAGFTPDDLFVSGGVPYLFVTSGTTSNLLALDPASGVVRWSADIGIHLNMAVAGGLAYGTTYRVDASGTPVIRFAALGAAPTDPLLVCQADLSTCNADLSTCSADLSSCQASDTQCQSDLGTATTDLSTCTSGLASCQASDTTCQSDLGTATTELSTCNGDLSSCQASDTQCQSDLGSATADLSTCTTGLSSCQASDAQCQSDLGSATADLSTCTTARDQCLADLTTKTSEEILCQADLQTATTALAECQATGGALESAVATGMTEVEDHLRAAFSDPAFTIPGDTPAEKLDALVQAIDGLQAGQAELLYQELGGGPANR